MLASLSANESVPSDRICAVITLFVSSTDYHRSSSNNPRQMSDKKVQKHDGDRHPSDQVMMDANDDR